MIGDNLSILVTGGAGYIGSHGVKVLKGSGESIIILDDLSSGHLGATQGCKFYMGDIGDVGLLEKIFKENDVYGVIHFAAKKSVEESVSDPEKYYDNNVVKTKILVDTMLRNSINKMVFSSTAAVYGEPDKDVVSEDDITEPINPYGETKLITEKMLEDYDNAYGLKFCSLRYFNAAGADPEGELGFADGKEKNVVPLLIRTAIDSKKGFTVFGDNYDTRDGTCIRDYIHVMDLATAHLKALKYLEDKDSSQIINLGSNNGHTVLELIKATEDVTGKKLDYKIGKRRAGDPAALIASNKKAKELLNWDLEFSDIKSILKDSYSWEMDKKY